MRSALKVLAIVFAAVGSLVPAAVGAQVVKEEVPGITSFNHIESTVACAGAITPDAIPKIKAMGFQSIINLRLETEPGARIEESKAAAKAAGIAYFHIPFSVSNPDPAAVDKFLEAIRTPGVEPAFIH